LHAGVIKTWMQELEDVLNTYYFPPELIFNFDEIIIDLSEHKMKVFVYAHNLCFFIENETKFAF
jgi:hypothetical protein